MPLIEIKNLHASIDGQPILKGLNLTIEKGEVHSIMGPNGSGKSTLANVLSGHESYKVTQGQVIYNGRDLLKLNADERAGEGLFLAFQYPVAIPGISGMQFLKAAINSVRKYREQEELDAMELMQLLKEKSKLVHLDLEMLKRAVNEGFSGGEKKRYEIFQMAVLEPTFSILDETDSGLDIDALRIVANGVNAMRADHRGFLVITHYQRLLQYIVPDFVHVLSDGQIVHSGGKELALELEDKGYTWLNKEPAEALK